jgi:hypothetical protein
MKVTQTPESTTAKPLHVLCDWANDVYTCPMCNSSLDIAVNPDKTTHNTFYEVLGNYCIVCNAYCMLSHPVDLEKQIQENKDIFYVQMITDFLEESSGCRVVGMPLFTSIEEFQALYEKQPEGIRIACTCPDDDCSEKDPKTIRSFLQKKDPNYKP